MESDLSAVEALAFAHSCKEDFEGVFWIDCTHRSSAGVLGDVARSLRVRLSGTADQNKVALKDFCDGRRCLFVFENIAPAHWDLVDLGVKTSVILTASTDLRPKLSFEEIYDLFSSWTRNSGECLRALGAAHWYLQQLPPQMFQLGSSMVAILKHYDRLAEAHEVLELLLNSAQERADLQTIHSVKWEQGWLLEHWNQPVDLNVASQNVSEPNQLTLFE